MKELTSEQVVENFDELINTAKEPILIKGVNQNAVLISESEWRGFQETLYLTSIPGMRESILKGLSTQLCDTSVTLDW